MREVNGRGGDSARICPSSNFMRHEAFCPAWDGCSFFPGPCHANHGRKKRWEDDNNTTTSTMTAIDDDGV